MDKKESFRNSNCEDQINMAERELSAFIRAVTELFGPEQARLSAKDWLDESERMEGWPRASSRDWRAVTVAASARLAEGLVMAQQVEPRSEHHAQYRLIRRYRQYYRPIVSSAPV
jgi:hypothetical protein